MHSFESLSYSTSRLRISSKYDCISDGTTRIISRNADKNPEPLSSPSGMPKGDDDDNEEEEEEGEEEKEEDAAADEADDVDDEEDGSEDNTIVEAPAAGTGASMTLSGRTTRATEDRRNKCRCPRRSLHHQLAGQFDRLTSGLLWCALCLLACLSLPMPSCHRGGALQGIKIRESWIFLIDQT